MAFFDAEELLRGIKEGVNLNSFTVYVGLGVRFEGHRGVLFFDDRKVRIRLKKGIVEISGNDLVVEELSKNEIFVSGRIEDVNLSGVVYDKTENRP